MGIVFFMSFAVLVVVTPLVALVLGLIYVILRVLERARWFRYPLVAGLLLLLCVPIYFGIGYWRSYHEAPEAKLDRWTAEGFSAKVQALEGVWYLDTVDPTFAFRFQATPEAIVELKAMLELQPEEFISFDYLPSITPEEWTSGMANPEAFRGYNENGALFMLYYSRPSGNAVLGIITI